MFDDPSCRGIFVPPLHLPRPRLRTGPALDDVATAFSVLADDLRVTERHVGPIDPIALGVFKRLLTAADVQLPETLQSAVEALGPKTDLRDAVLLCGQLTAFIGGGGPVAMLAALRRDLPDDEQPLLSWVKDVLFDALAAVDDADRVAVMEVIVEPMLRDADLTRASDLRILVGQAAAVLAADRHEPGDFGGVAGAELNDLGPF